jgi:CRP-like cAMP-binding protein
LIREGEMPEAMFLVAPGTVEVPLGEGAEAHVLPRASPGDSLGIHNLITGSTSLATARALTPVTAYCIDQAGIAAVLRACSGLASSLEAQASRGLAWLRCEAAARDDQEMRHPDMLRARLWQFLHQLNSGPDANSIGDEMTIPPRAGSDRGEQAHGKQS